MDRGCGSERGADVHRRARSGVSDASNAIKYTDMHESVKTRGGARVFFFVVVVMSSCTKQSSVHPFILSGRRSSIRLPCDLLGLFRGNTEGFGPSGVSLVCSEASARLDSPKTRYPHLKGRVQPPCAGNPESASLQRLHRSTLGSAAPPHS